MHIYNKVHDIGNKTLNITLTLEDSVKLWINIQPYLHFQNLEDRVPTTCPRKSEPQKTQKTGRSFIR